MSVRQAKRSRVKAATISFAEARKFENSRPTPLNEIFPPGDSSGVATETLTQSAKKRGRKDESDDRKRAKKIAEIDKKIAAKVEALASLQAEISKLRFERSKLSASWL